MRQIRMSVRSLIEFIYREGDIDASMRSGVTPQEGQRIHQLVQSRYEGFQKEVSVKFQRQISDGITLVLSGRMDGLKVLEDAIVIDEIKSVFESAEQIESPQSFLHWAQAKLYGGIYLQDKTVSSIRIQLTYYSIRSESTVQFEQEYTQAELATFLEETILKYQKWLVLEGKVMQAAELSSETMTFPYKDFRPGQDTLAKACYTCIRDANHLIAEAPTGIGKTLSTLFPALKAYGKGHTERIFYLTSKSPHRQVALDALMQLEANGLQAIVVGLQAKEKLCLNDVFKCTPEICPYAKGHFDRVNDALYHLLSQGGHFSPERVRSYAEEAVVCPFELALDLTNFAQVIVCDYNYYLDPFVQLKRHFMDPSSAVILVDEAHNLYERARDMYTAVLNIATLKAAIKDAKDLDKTYTKHLNQLKKVLQEEMAQVDDQGCLETLSAKLLNSLNTAMLYFLDEGRFTDVPKQDTCVNHFFEMHRWMRLMEYFDDHFALLVENQDGGSLILRCLDPSKLLVENYAKVRTVVAFSATLSPFVFYQSVLGHAASKRLQVGSPFDVNNRLLALNVQHSTYQKDRLNTLDAIASDVGQLIGHHGGNFLIFCPSYTYLEQLHEQLVILYPEVQWMPQKQNMGEAERQDFLDAFQGDLGTQVVGLAVLGGVFSEGVDLKGTRLTGVVIIGVGMPTVTRERQLMQAFYDAKGEPGFDFAFTYPGLNKVFQAGGRLIRTETDRGILMLIGKRFGETRYLREMPRHWHPYQIIRRSSDFEGFLKEISRFLS